MTLICTDCYFIKRMDSRIRGNDKREVSMKKFLGIVGMILIALVLAGCTTSREVSKESSVHSEMQAATANAYLQEHNAKVTEDLIIYAPDDSGVLDTSLGLLDPSIHLDSVETLGASNSNTFVKSVIDSLKKTAKGAPVLLYHKETVYGDKTMNDSKSNVAAKKDSSGQLHSEIKTKNYTTLIAIWAIVFILFVVGCAGYRYLKNKTVLL